MPFQARGRLGVCQVKKNSKSPRLAGRECGADSERTGTEPGQVVGGAAQLRASLQGGGLGLEAAIVGEVVPEQLDAVLPEVDGPLRGHGDIAVRGAECRRAEQDMVLGQVGAEGQPS